MKFFVGGIPSSALDIYWVTFMNLFLIRFRPSSARFRNHGG